MTATQRIHTLPETFMFISAVTGDIRDRDGLREAFGQARPEIVFHLAAQPIVRASYQDAKSPPPITFPALAVETAMPCSLKKELI